MQRLAPRQPQLHAVTHAFKDILIYPQSMNAHGNQEDQHEGERVKNSRYKGFHFAPINSKRGSDTIDLCWGL